MQQTMKKINKDTPNKEFVFEQLRGVTMTNSAQTIILAMLESAWFDYCVIVKQLTEALGLSKVVVEKSLSELIGLGIVRQQALYGNERTYVVNRHFFSSKRPTRRSREELLTLMTVLSNK